MPYGIYLSAAGANAQNHRLEVLSHNLANINTPGFKPQLAMLQARHSEAIERGEVSPGSRSIDDIGGGVQINPSETLLHQGPIEQTERKTDFAINDKNSFFVVQRGEEQLLTRAGGFLFNSQGVLTTTDGDQVMGSDGNPIRIDPSKRYDTNDGGIIQQGSDVRSLMVVKAREPGDLSRVGDNLYRSLTPAEPIANKDRKVVSGYLEKSAVVPTTAMMELIEASRLYEANLRMIQHQDQALGSLFGRLLRV
jgi:flagellar basal-body rod protein FlgF/flagellar basal-body rod protein FlgG